MPSFSSPIVSVVMSVYNGGSFLTEAIESILNQSFKDFEFIIIDDGSVDDSAQIIDTYKNQDNRVQVYLQENMGLIESLNRGCKLAKGKYIARMDADDIAIENRLLLQYKFMEQNPAIGIVGGAVQFIDASGKSLKASYNPTTDSELRPSLQENCPFWHPTVFMRTNVFETLGGYRKIMTDAEDHDMWLRAADTFELANLGTIVLKYRLHPYQVTARKFRQMAISRLLAQSSARARMTGKLDPLNSVSEITPNLLADLGISEADVDSSVANRCLWSVQTMCEAGDYKSAAATLFDLLNTTNLNNAEKWVVANLHLIAAKLYWNRGEISRSILSVFKAILARPVILGRPIRHVFRSSNS